jgi:hypothetical protein
MARGIPANIPEYIANITPYLEVGCSLHEAALYGETPYRTIKQHYDEDEEVRKIIDRIMNTPILRARQSVVAKMDEDADLALKYLERRKKDEFSLKSETDLTSKGEKLTGMVIGFEEPNSPSS